MGKIGQFIKEYSGEVLRNLVMSFVNHHLSNLVERDVKEHAKQEKKTEMLSLTADKINGEEMVLSGKIAKMYLAQLDP